MSSPSSGAKTSPDSHSWWITNRWQARGSEYLSKRNYPLIEGGISDF